MTYSYGIDNDVIEEIKMFYFNSYNNVFIKVDKVSNDILKDLINVCDSTKHIEEVINFYDDEESPGFNNWTDVEGEGYGWLWLKEEDDESKWHGLIRGLLLKFIEYKEKNSFDEYVIIVNTGDKIIYHFIERKSLMRDTIYTFSDNEIIY